MTAEFTIGQRIGDYEILSILGLGGMGKVYKVRNVIADRVEAMKILLPDLTSHQSLADRFLREIRLLGSLNHPNIACLRTAMTYENQLVMIMEFVEGETLANRLSRAPISTAEAVNYSDQVLSALSYAHKQGIIHRDIKPANMMLTPQGVVKLMDFGIARSGTDGSLTSTGTTLGSLNYMPPEQVRGEAADSRSDIYSYGVSLYELLTGQLPFKGDSQYSLMTAHLNEEPAAPITVRTDLPPSLNEIILMAMAKNPMDRFQTADAFRNALKSVPVSEMPSAGTTFTSAPTTPRPNTATASSDATLVDTVSPSVSMPVMPTHPGSKTPASTKPPTVAPTPRPAPVPSMQPTAPMTAPGPVVAAANAAPPRSGGRGVWIALGSLVGVGVLIAAGIYIPRSLKTHADPNQATFPSGKSDNSGTTGSTDSKSDKDSNAPVAIDTPVGSVHVDGQGNVAIQSPNGSIKVSPDGNATVTAPGVSVKTGSNASGGDAGKNNGNPKPWRDANATNQPPPPPVPAGPSPEEIAKVEDEADQLNVRAAAASRSVDTLRHQQQAAGYNLRADIAASEERMQVYLAKGNAALKVKDLVNAQKYFDLADSEISKVEKFLGH